MFDVDWQLLELDPQRLPRHVAIIMDGNGRWAKKRGWMRVRGHERGSDTVRSITTESARLGIEHLTLYAFSSENWSRPQREIKALMDLLQTFLRKELSTLKEHDIRLEAIGRLDRLPEDTRTVLFETIAATAHHKRMTLRLALSYGGRHEIVDACKSIIIAAQKGEIQPEDMDSSLFGSYLYTGEAPDVDVVIRTAGEMRLSNFLPWQSVYAEFVSLPCYWPEMTREDFHNALRAYEGRERRFGRLKTGRGDTHAE